MNIENINPMDWHNTKMLDFIPEHLVRVKFRHHRDRAKVLAWLEENTTGRCAIEEVIEPDIDNNRWAIRMREEYQIGFEEPADATMYTMFFT
jgi:hypothetical protein